MRRSSKNKEKEISDKPKRGPGRPPKKDKDKSNDDSDEDRQALTPPEFDYDDDVGKGKIQAWILLTVFWDNEEIGSFPINHTFSKRSLFMDHGISASMLLERFGDEVSIPRKMLFDGIFQVGIRSEYDYFYNLPKTVVAPSNNNSQFILATRDGDDMASNLFLTSCYIPTISAVGKSKNKSKLFHVKAHKHEKNNPLTTMFITLFIKTNWYYSHKMVGRLYKLDKYGDIVSGEEEGKEEFQERPIVRGQSTDPKKLKQPRRGTQLQRGLDKLMGKKENENDNNNANSNDRMNDWGVNDDPIGFMSFMNDNMQNDPPSPPDVAPRMSLFGSNIAQPFSGFSFNDNNDNNRNNNRIERPQFQGGAEVAAPLNLAFIGAPGAARTVLVHKFHLQEYDKSRRIVLMADMKKECEEATAVWAEHEMTGNTVVAIYLGVSKSSVYNHRSMWYNMQHHTTKDENGNDIVSPVGFTDDVLGLTMTQFAATLGYNKLEEMYHAKVGSWKPRKTMLNMDVDRVDALINILQQKQWTPRKK